MKFAIVFASLVSFAGIAKCADAPPPCLPFLDANSSMQANGYSGSSISMGETENNRWLYYTCTKNNKSEIVAFVGTKETSITALTDRVAKIRTSESPFSELLAAWKRYANLPLNDEKLKEGMRAIKEHAARK